MLYRLINDYSADWPFWGGKEGAGLCADDDPDLSEEIATAARAWATVTDASAASTATTDRKPVHVARESGTGSVSPAYESANAAKGTSSSTPVHRRGV
ncbi:hypothetical protein OVA26_17315 [Microbacterium sp. SL62]|uniref:hypothetical protein n=1 Tax=Microbacterium sp. SL62 TaxID=2995139 RepID=UPI002276E0BE|nr:hypothetical protein [Microbacterium sp. SL62]MCY1718698.1 hypothetical protein [Microbacterium sp. SL62]